MITGTSKGFTIVELLVVVAIIGILSAIGVVSYNGYVSGSKKTAAENTIQQIALAQTEYYSNNGEYFLSCLLYTSPSPRDKRQSRMPSSA